VNPKLGFGAALLLALIIVALLPQRLAPYPRGFSDPIRFEETAQGTEWYYAPEAPSPIFPLGSDHYGYDLLTVLLWGLRWTLACVSLTAAMKTLLGGALGVARALSRADPRKDRGFSPLAGIPSFVFVFFLIYPVTINSPLGSLRLFFYQCAVMTLFDLGGIIASTAAKTSALMGSSFVESAVSSGAKRPWLLRYHILPFLGEELLETFADQTVAVLQLVGRLGIFSLFIGGTTRTYDPLILTSTTGEIAGLIGLYRERLLMNRWMLFAPLSAYLVILAAFRSFSSGLRQRDRRQRRVRAA
jgi:peptide/nickel transport system permease protein